MTHLNWPTYDGYKDSGVEWIGDVPAHWDVEPGRRCVVENKEKNTGMKEGTVLSLSYGRVIVKGEDDLTGLVPESFETYQVVRPGDIIIRGTDLQNDKTSLRTGLARDKGIITSAYINLRPKREIDPAFLHYLLHSYDVKKVFYALGSGLRQNLSYDDFKYLRLPIPSTEEQHAITAFLDEKCAKVDEAVRIKEEQIALLRERRQILIQQAVTRGLNPDAPMKDSGIEWMGQIPAHWNVRRVKHVGLISPSRTLDRVIPNDDVVVFLPMEAVLPDGTVVQDDRRKSKEIYSGFTYFRKGDVVVAKITPCFENGKGAWLCDLETDYGFGTTELHVIRPVAVNGAFLHRVLNSEAFLSIGERFMVGSAGQKRVPTAFLADFPIPLPPPSEQLEVVAYIGEEARKIDRGIAIKESQIAALKEYKTTLINAAVTGKIKVA